LAPKRGPRSGLRVPLGSAPERNVAQERHLRARTGQQGSRLQGVPARERSTAHLQPAGATPQEVGSSASDSQPQSRTASLAALGERKRGSVRIWNITKGERVGGDLPAYQGDISDLGRWGPWGVDAMSFTMAALIRP